MSYFQNAEMSRLDQWQNSNSNIKLSCDHHSFMQPISNSCAYPWSSNQHYTHLGILQKFANICCTFRVYV